MKDGHHRLGIAGRSLPTERERLIEDPGGIIEAPEFDTESPVFRVVSSAGDALPGWLPQSR